MTDTTLVAKTRVKFGGEGRMDPKLGFIRTADATTVEPGKTFEIDADTAEELIRVGAAMSPVDYEAEQRASKTTEDRIEEMRAEVGKADTAKKAREGDSQAINSQAHLAAQDREETEIAEAQKKAKKGKGGADDDEKKAKAGDKK